MQILEIRPEQLAPFREQAFRRFRNELATDIRVAHAEDVADMSAQELDDFIKYGIEVCDAYGITAEALVGAYIHLMFDLGMDFDEDPDYPWAAAILNNSSLSEEDVISHLLASAEAAEEQSAG